jgi:hypothetical protein
MSLIWVRESRFYWLIVDDYRFLSSIKNVIVEMALNHVYLFNNYPSIRKRLLTLIEGLSNV